MKTFKRFATAVSGMFLIFVAAGVMPAMAASIEDQQAPRGTVNATLGDEQAPRGQAAASTDDFQAPRGN